MTRRTSSRTAVRRSVTPRPVTASSLMRSPVTGSSLTASSAARRAGGAGARRAGVHGRPAAQPPAAPESLTTDPGGHARGPKVPTVDAPVTIEVEADLPPEAVAALRSARWRIARDGRARLTMEVPARSSETVVAAIEQLLGVRADRRGTGRRADRRGSGTRPRAASGRHDG